MYVCASMYMYVCMCVCACMYMYVLCMYMYALCVCMYVLLGMYAFMYVLCVCTYVCVLFEESKGTEVNIPVSKFQNPVNENYKQISGRRRNLEDKRKRRKDEIEKEYESSKISK